MHPPIATAARKQNWHPPEARTDLTVCSGAVNV